MKGKTQKLLLNQSIKHVGRVGDVVEVSSGYARNFLVPKGHRRPPDAEQPEEGRSPQGRG